MAESRKHVFISHLHEDDHRLGPLKDLLCKSGMEVRDGSIQSVTQPSDDGRAMAMGLPSVSMATTNGCTLLCALM